MTAATQTMLVPGPARRPVTLVVLVSAVVFAVMAWHFAGGSEAGRVDTRVDAVVDPLDTHHWLIAQATLLGSKPSVIALAFAMSAVCLLLGRYRLAILAVAGPGITGVCTTVLKPALGRTLEGVFAFPSGHTGGGTSLGLVAAFIVISLLRPGRGGALAILAVGALVVGGGVGAAMVASNAHYPTDTIGGFCTAVVVVCGVALALDRLAAALAPRMRA